MSMALADAKVYIARVIGGQNDAGILALAADAIKATATKWDNRHDWGFLLKDNYNAPITVTAGVSDYAAPADFKNPYSALLTTTKRPLGYIRQRQYDRLTADQSSQRGTYAYTLFNSSGFTASDQTQYIRLIFTPDTADSLLLRYYRRISPTADPVDVDDAYLYTFLDDCKVWLVAQKNANDPRLQALVALSERALADAISTDQDETEDEDIRLISQAEMFGLGSSEYPDDYFPGGMVVS